jgi:hypothetical protein
MTRRSGGLGPAVLAVLKLALLALLATALPRAVCQQTSVPPELLGGGGGGVAEQQLLPPLNGDDWSRFGAWVAADPGLLGVAPPLPARCELDVLRLPADAEAFAALARSPASRPVVLDLGPAHAAANAPFRDATRLQALLARFGHANLTLSASNTFSYDKREVPLWVYIDSMRGRGGVELASAAAPPTTTCDTASAAADGDTSQDGNAAALSTDPAAALNTDPAADTGHNATDTFYHFGDHSEAHWAPLHALYHRPDLLAARTRGTLAFGIGRAGSGVAFHEHGPVLAETIHGRKVWFLAAPLDRPAFDPERTSLQWFREWAAEPSSKRSGAVLTCAMDPGSRVLYIPSHWWHATINAAESVFVATFV